MLSDNPRIGFFALVFAIGHLGVGENQDIVAQDFPLLENSSLQLKRLFMAP